MGLYERAFEASWAALDKNSATERAYALGVAAATGEFHREELEAIRAEMDTSYNKSVVDLAFDEGKNEVREIDPDADDGGTVWAELVEGETVTVDEDEDTVPTGGQTGLPEAIDKIEAIARPERDSTGAVEFPEFLERD
jgi:hypothetical protein